MNQPLVRANGLYFADCGLVIQAENTVFRVSRDFLGLNSTIFRDMLTLPTHPDAEMLDGAPLVRLPDAAKDVDVMFRAMLYSDFFYPPPLPTSLEILTSVLRMSHKYDIDILRKRALAHLNAIHPTTLDALDALPRRTGSWFGDSGPVTEDLLATILLAREFSLDWILPLAFYRVCLFISDRQIIDSALSSQDKATVFTGCRVLQGKESYRIVSFLSTPECEDCHDRDSCGDLRCDIDRSVQWARFRQDAPKLDLPLEIWKEEHHQDTLDLRCFECRFRLREEAERLRQDFWKILPATFGLPEWAVLEQARKAAMARN
ncbi:hypothetical protein C8F01DRAFT_1126805 [Mycena amicta]|nr:hypothetical protein C8F01DRAFT_1126805 [Mycena amicta]